jgi:hypothetical protein
MSSVASKPARVSCSTFLPAPHSGTSDHEVNIKILLDRSVLAGALAEEDRSATGHL